MRPGEKQFYFHIGDQPYVLKDCLWLTQEEFDAMSEEQLTALKMERYNRWYETVTSGLNEPPPQPEEPTITPMYDWIPGQDIPAETPIESNTEIVDTSNTDASNTSA
jgi:hypothetical protein